MKHLKLILLTASCLYALNFFSQAESTKTLHFEQYKERILKYHPIVKQAQLRVENGKREIQKSKGALDPVFNSEINGKNFNDKNYYEFSNTGLKIPTWFGVDFKTGYEINRGYYISNDEATPGSGLWYAGVEIPLAKGLLFDERRASIQTAKVFLQNSKNEQELIINDLLLDAYASYWSWYEAYQKLLIAQEGIEFARTRFAGVKENARLGEVPSIDTVEAKIQLDNRKMELLQAQNDFKNAGSLLNLFLWTDELIPLEIEEGTIPELTIQAQYNNKLLPFQADSIQDNLPQIQTYLYKLEQLEIEERWKKEQLKPTLNLRFTPLSQPVGNNPFNNFSINNYKYGLSVYVPLLLRKERAGLAQTRIKINSAQLDLAYKISELKTKTLNLRNDFIRLYEQWEIQKIQVSQAKQLRDSEQTRFEIGESSLFLVNSRELSYLSYKVKLTEIEAKLKTTEAKLAWVYSELF